MKIILEEGPEIIRTDEGDIQRGIPFEASDELGEKFLNHPVYKFREINERYAQSAKRKAKKEE